MEEEKGPSIEINENDAFAQILKDLDNAKTQVHKSNFERHIEIAYPKSCFNLRI